MSLQMEIIVFIQEDHPPDWSSFTSDLTYLQSKSSWCPSFNSQVLRVRLSHIWPISLLFSHREFFRHKVPWAYYQCHGHLWDCTFQKKVISTHWGTQFSLSWGISDSMCSTSGSSAFSVTASHEYTGQNFFWSEKMSFQTAKQKSPGQWHQGTTEEEQPMSWHFNRKGLFRSGKIEGAI